MSKYIQTFSDISKHDAHRAGGKGASLGEMTKAGISVPPGFVVLASAFEAFLKDEQLIADIDAALHSVDHEKMHTVEGASEKIQAMILSRNISEKLTREILDAFKELNCTYVAVRSSATAEDSASAAWAGQLETYLNTTETDLLKNIQRCWASLFTPRAIFYRFEKGLHETTISVAVVVQKMVQSEVSGIAFSVHPVTQDYNQMIIEAGFGLGEAIVSGQITPDSYVVEKEPFRIIDMTVNMQDKVLQRGATGNHWIVLGEKGSQQKLHTQEIERLARHILFIENHYGFPVDVEWAYAGGEFFITQSRPITTLSGVQKEINSKKQTFLSSIKKSRKWIPIVERHICLLIRDLILSGEKSAIFNEALGVEISPIGDAIVRGHVFSPIESIENTNRALQELIDSYGHQKLMEIGKSCIERAEKLHQYLQKSDDELGIRLKNFKELYSHLTCYLLIIVFSEKFLEKQVENLIKEKTGGEDKRYFESIVYVRKFNRNTEELIAILKLSKLIKEKNLDIENNTTSALLQKHVEEFGWLGTRWQFENSWTIEDIKPRIKRYLSGSPEKELANVLQPREEAETVTKEFVQKFNLNTQEREFIDLVKEFVFLRTFRTESLARANFLAKPLLHEAAKQLKISEDDLVFLSVDEIIDALIGQVEYTDVISQRKGGYYMILCENIIEMFIGDEKGLIDELNIFNIVTGEGDKITGQVAWRGFAKGKIKIVKDQKDIAKVQDGDILVAVMTFPNYIPAMEKAAAFVTDEGGILCHASVISREFKKPCIIGTKIATQVLKDGDLVEVDADQGIVRILKESNAPAEIDREQNIVAQIKKIDWTRLIAREIDFFIFSSAFEVNTFLMKELLGFGYTKMLCVYKSGKGTLYHSQKEMNESEEYFRHILEERQSLLKEWLALEEKISKEEIPKDALKLLDYFQEMLVYGVLLPTRALFSIEKNPHLSSWRHIFEKIRDRGMYPLFYSKNVKPILESLASTVNIPIELAVYMTIGEVRDFFLKGVHIQQEELEKRKNGCVLYRIGEKEGVSYGNIIIEQESTDNQKNSSQLKGSIACRGKARGNVKIVNRIEDMVKFVQGDILVSISTNPSLMPVIRMATAIVTDEGGIISHAAIISRELKIPCIIGTKIATQVFKDGDVVEVDADQGIVTLLGK